MPQESGEVSTEPAPPVTSARPPVTHDGAPTGVAPAWAGCLSGPVEKPGKEASRMTAAKARILIVEDEGSGAAELREWLKALGYPVCGSVACGRRAIAAAAQARPDLALVDLGLAGAATAPEVAAQLGSRCDVPVVYLVDGTDGAEGTEGDAWQRAAAGNPYGCLVRPFGMRQLHLTIETAVASHARERAQRATAIRLQRDVDRLQDLTSLMKTVLDSMSEGVAALDENGVLLFHNPSALLLGRDGAPDRSVDTWLQEHDVLQPDCKTPVAADGNPLLLALTGTATDDVELFVRDKRERQGVHLSVSGRPLRGDAGVAKGAVIVFRDITELKRAAAELERTMAELRYQSEVMETTFRSISDGIVVANAAGEFLYVNPAAEQIVGLGATEGPQDEWDKTYGTYHPDRETPMATEDLPLIRAIRGGESVDDEDVFIRNRHRPDGVYIRVSARPLLDKIGGIRGGVIIFRDVTERVHAEEALAQAFAEGRWEIVDTILHNIGNAITSVTTGIETVRRSLENDRVGRRLSALADAIGRHRDDWIDYLRNDAQGRQVRPFIVALAQGFATHQEELIGTVDRVRDRANHIADIVRTQKVLGSAAMDRKDVNLHETLAGAVRVLHDSLVKRHIRTSIDCKRAPREIRTRESQFHQMLVNLIKNAIEAIDDLAAAQGSARAPRIRIKSYADGKFLVVEVTDNGIGIRTRDTRVLFAPGYTTKRSGSGLGLHSAANFVIAAGGRIQPVAKGAGRGTTMRVLLPLSSVSSPSQAGTAPVAESAAESATGPGEGAP